MQQTRQLVAQSKVFAIFNSVGTEHNEAIAPLLNQLGIPQLFGGTGARALAKPKRAPWTLGYLPSFYGEGAIYGRYLAEHSPRAKIAVLYENSDYGKDLLAGPAQGPRPAGPQTSRRRRATTSPTPRCARRSRA